MTCDYGWPVIGGSIDLGLIIVVTHRNLMAKDEFRNLGFHDEDVTSTVAKAAASTATDAKSRANRLEELKRENEELKRKHGKA